MRTSLSPLFRVAALAGALVVSLAAFADGNGVGRPSGGGSTYEWQTKITGHDRIQLTVVAPDGTVMTREFGPGRNPSFRLSDIEGAVEDGAYSYELRVVPKISADVKRKLEDARANNDEAAARKLMRQAGLDQPMLQSGTITVLNGSIVSPDQVEASAHDEASVTTQSGRSVTTNAPSGLKPVVNDQVIPDDLIVQQSLCVGFDCVNGESFGFDTIRLKENNTRIKFEDTSTGTFPTNDWQLTANDSASGGTNKFSIEDITGAKVPFTVEAGATTNSVYIDSTGRVGFRTSNPVLDLHANTSNTPGMRLEQNNSGGFTAQTWDIAGNEANFFVRDVTSGSRLPFRIRPGAPTSSIDISADGDVGIGTASPESRLHVVATNAMTQPAVDSRTVLYLERAASSTDGATIQLMSGNQNYGMLSFGDTDNNNVGQIAYNHNIDSMSFKIADVERLWIRSTGNVGIGTSSPTSRLHVNGGDIRVSGGSFIDDGTTLNVPDYVFDEKYELMSVGELASFIRENKHLPNVPSESQVKREGVNISAFQMRLLEKVEELTLYTIDQHDQIGTLQTQNKELMDRLAALEQKLAEKQ